MHKIELKVDDTIYDKLMRILEMLPSDKLELVSSKVCDDAAATIIKQTRTISYEEKINALLKMEHLAHFKFFEDPSRILYTRESGTPTHAQDFTKLVKLLKQHKIKHNDIGIDVLMIEED